MSKISKQKKKELQHFRTEYAKTMSKINENLYFVDIALNQQRKDIKYIEDLRDKISNVTGSAKYRPEEMIYNRMIKQSQSYKNQIGHYNTLKIKKEVKDFITPVLIDIIRNNPDVKEALKYALSPLEEDNSEDYGMPKYIYPF